MIHILWRMYDNARYHIVTIYEDRESAVKHKDSIEACKAKIFARCKRDNSYLMTDKEKERLWYIDPTTQGDAEFSTWDEYTITSRQTFSDFKAFLVFKGKAP